MEDLDQLLEGIQDTSINKVVNNTIMNEIDHKTINNEDDFFKFLDEPSQTISRTSDKKDNAVIDDPEDFLDWLNNDNNTTVTEKVINNLTIFQDDNIVDNYNSSTAIVAEQQQQQEEELIEVEESNIGVTNIQSVDNFFDEVFGKSPVYASSQSITNVDILEVSLEDKIKSIIRSNFPDIEQLRQLIHEYGYIPATLRAQIWSLLLTESCIEDDEITHYDDTNGIQYDKKQVIIADCNAVVSNASMISKNNNNQGELEVVRKDMQDILLLYCQRRKVDYKSVLCRILSTLLTGTNRFSRAVASSCFYSIASEFLPLLNLSPTAQSLGVNLTHNWLKLLLSYHAPALVQHLDRVLPQWEEATKEISSSQAISIASSQRGSCTLDELERELGLDVRVPSSYPTSTNSSGAINNDVDNINKPMTIIESAPPSSNASSSSCATTTIRSGCIPSHWILGVFSSSLPVTEAALVLDWAILNNQKYAGFYLTVTLLCLYEQELLTMSGSTIRQWLEDIETNKIDWFRSSSVLPISKLTNQVKVPENWICFVKGWLQATSALIHSTPKSFQDTLSQLEQWASVAADRQPLDRGSKHSFSNQSSHSNSIHSNNNSLHGNIREQLSNKEQLYDTNNKNSNDDYNDDDDNEQNKDNTLKFNGKVNLMEKFRKLSMSFQNDLNDIRSATATPDENKSNSHVHDQKVKYPPICIWSSIEEVIPCICSNRRRATISAVNIFNFYYLHAIKIDNNSASNTTTNNTTAMQDQSSHTTIIPAITTTIRSGSTSCYLLSKLIENQAPFYFAIDCRSTTELALGQFPKAYAFDPIGLTDGDAVTKLLDAIETLASTVHICIIGVGESYITKQQGERMKTVTTGEKKNRSTTNDIDVCLSEYYAKLNAVAMFFLKKSFKYISILDGGFLAAAKYLHSPESPFTLEASLVDIDRMSLDAALGLSTANTSTTLNNALSQRTNFVSSIGNLFQTMSSKNYNSITTTTIPTAAATSSSSSSSSSLSAITRNISSTNISNSDNNLSSTEEVNKDLVPQSSTSSSSSSSISNSKTSILPETSASTTIVAPTTTNTTASSTDIFSSWGKKWSASLETIKKSVTLVSSSTTTTAGNAGSYTDMTNPSSLNANSNNTTLEGTTNKDMILTNKVVKKGNFVIDDNEDDGMGPKEIADTTTISINKTEREKEQALAIHKMTGLRKGDTVVINRQDLPGAVLFPSIKYKEILIEDPNYNLIKTSINEQQQQEKPQQEEVVEPSDGLVDNRNELLELSNDDNMKDNVFDDINIEKNSNTSSINNQNEIPKIRQQVQVHRYLVVSRERFIVLDSHGGGVGSKAVVKSNRHLTELLKMTFRKKDPEFVTLYFANKETKPCQYRISKRNEFITSLQKNMERFK